jgi:GNAT superfamily N-acetyltransferase
MSQTSAGSAANWPISIPHLTFRAAGVDDYEFALALYLESVKPLLLALGRWDEERILLRFSQGFELEHIQVLRREGTDIGWMQVSETVEELHLDQLHLVDHVRNNQIGTHLVRMLQSRAKTVNTPLALNIFRGNRAKVLYERLGFRIVGGDEERIRMLWSGEPADESRQ